LSRYWLTPAYEDGFDEKVANINDVYKYAAEKAKQGQRFESVDEMTSVQALERNHPGLPMLPGKVERSEFEYIRHGTLCFTCNFEDATGELVVCTAGKTRNEQDFLEHIKGRVASDLRGSECHFICDNLNTHMSESLVCYVAEESDLTIDLVSKANRAFSDPTHRFSLHAQTCFPDEPNRNLV
jgi:hypothetical protein